ncbi:MAG TPA: ATP-binding cassette domain-containing protein [Bacteroidales bacterium]
MISIKQLVVSYQLDKPVIKGLNLKIEESKIHGIVGLNGSGKTTLLNAIFGLKRPVSGIILYKGEKATKKHFSYLVTENYFYSNITGREYLQLFKNKDFLTGKWNELFLLPLDELIDNYSSGMKKKLALMGTLKQDKPVMILDEPFNGLDIESTRILRMVLLKLKEQGKTIIITSHIIETLTNLCDSIHFLEDGNIKFSKSKSEFAAFEKEIFQSIEEKNLKLVEELTNG